jgi:hypothetical protein
MAFFTRPSSARAVSPASIRAPLIASTASASSLPGRWRACGVWCTPTIAAVMGTLSGCAAVCPPTA